MYELWPLGLSVEEESLEEAVSSIMLTSGELRDKSFREVRFDTERRPLLVLDLGSRGTFGLSPFISISTKFGVEAYNDNLDFRLPDLFRTCRRRANAFHVNDYIHDFLLLV